MAIALNGGAFAVGGILTDGATTQFAIDLSVPPYNMDFKGNMPFLRQDIPSIVTVYSTIPGQGSVQDYSFTAAASLNKYVLTITLNKPIPLNTPELSWSATLQFLYAFRTL